MRLSNVLMIDNKYELLSNYSKFHLDRMSPSFYDDDMDILTLEKMMYHKDLHDECLLIMTSLDPSDYDTNSFLNKLISYCENLEDYESCSYLRNIQLTL